MIWMLADYGGNTGLGQEATTYTGCVANNVAAGQTRAAAEAACTAAGPWPDTATTWLRQVELSKKRSLAPIIIGAAVVAAVFMGARALARRKGK